MPDKTLDQLEPKIVWQIFKEITQVPRPSKKEGKIRKWVKNWAAKNSIKIKEDKTGNLLLSKDAAPGCKNYPTLILQGHLDMVCEKQPEVVIDFEKDPINVLVEDDIVRADGTTLGADNGIGMAFGLAALVSPELKHGPLEVLLTVDEETGLTGAFALEAGFFSGKYLLNIDSEEVGKITISSAGGGGTDFTFKSKVESKSNYKGLKLVISGLKGGHSGVDIDLPRLNAIKLGIDGLLEHQDSLLLNSINAGSAHNAIPRDFEGIFLVPDKKHKSVLRRLKQWRKNTLEIAGKSEPTVKIDISQVDEKQAFNSEITRTVLNLLLEIIHGPLTYSKEIVGLVQTSNNLAVIDTTDKMVNVHVSTRSSMDEELVAVRTKLKELGKKFKAKVTQDEAYPGWKPDLKSPFLKLVKSVYEEVINDTVELEAIHGGLECGLFVSLDPKLQVTSIGANIHNAHSPDEYLEIESVGIIWDVVVKVIENINQLK
ncbi:MAG: aminoacyl-histidine dipeptidase [Asgard group archaeon]|nr:aminoacyl-histidine dipeptidase [Asgard group archaeon]